MTHANEPLATDTAATGLSDDEITALIADPAKIMSHETALEIIAVLDAEIANIQTQVDAATIEANVRPLTPERQAWLRRASYAGAMRRNERHRVYQRDKELRGTKGIGNMPPKDPHKAEANLLKQQRLADEAKTRRAKKELEREKQRTLQLQLVNERKCLPEMIEALMPFARYFELNDCAERADDDALEVPVADLRRAFNVLKKSGAVK